MLDKKISGIEIETLDLYDPSGKREWVAGLFKNTTMKKLTANKFEYVGYTFVDFLRRCSSLHQFELLEYDGKNQGSESNNDECLMKIQLGCQDDQKWQPPSTDYALVFQLAYTNSGAVFFDMDSRNAPISIFDRKHPRWKVHLDLFLETFQNLLTFRREEPKKLKIKLHYVDFEGCDVFFHTVSACNAPVVELDLHDCHFTEQDAIQFGRLLDTDASGANIKALRLSDLKGSTAWVTGLYKNKSIKALRLECFNFLHSALHFLLNGKASKLKGIVLFDLAKEENGKAHCVDDGTLTNRVDTNNTTASTATTMLTSLEAFICGYNCEYDENDSRLSKSICESIGNVLLQSTKLKLLQVKSLTISQEYGFMKDAASCQEIRVEKTSFEPRVLASLINNNGGQLKRLGFDNYWNAGEKKVVELLDLVDLTLLDELHIGTFVTTDIFAALCRQFAQNKGPRKFIRYSYSNDDLGFDDDFYLYDRAIDLEELQTS